VGSSASSAALCSPTSARVVRSPSATPAPVRADRGPPVRFWGWEENEREQARDYAELSARAAAGLPLYGESNQPEWVQAAAHRNSVFSQLKFCPSPLFLSCVCALTYGHSGVPDVQPREPPAPWHGPGQVRRQAGGGPLVGSGLQYSNALVQFYLAFFHLLILGLIVRMMVDARRPTIITPRSVGISGLTVAINCLS
jgi:hypothetical protein